MITVSNLPLLPPAASDNEEGVEDGEEADESDTEQPARDGKAKTTQQEPSHDEPDGKLGTEW